MMIKSIYEDFFDDSTELNTNTDFDDVNDNNENNENKKFQYTLFIKFSRPSKNFIKTTENFIKYALISSIASDYRFNNLITDDNSLEFDFDLDIRASAINIYSFGRFLYLFRASHFFSIYRLRLIRNDNSLNLFPRSDSSDKNVILHGKETFICSLFSFFS